jgi:hypothetical protein
MDAPSVTVASGPPAPRVAPSLRCLRCNYDLRGFPETGNCPECGLPVARSADAVGGELRHAPPGWLASLSWGAWLILLAPIAGFVHSAYLLQRLPRINSLEVYFGVPAALDVVFAAGVWLLTRPQPRRAGTHRIWRSALRLAALVPLLQTGSVYLLMAGRVSRFWVDHRDWAMLGFLPFPALLFLHLRRLALRVPAARLAEHCAIVAALGTVSFLGAASGFFVYTSQAVNFAFGVATFLTILWAALVVVWFAIVVHRAHRTSVAAWTGVKT